MSTFTLQRKNLDPDKPTMGELFDPEGKHVCFTLEPPDKDNQEDVSCILPGTYQVVPNPGAKPWRLLRVPGRTQVDIHAGNSVADTLGCILVGTARTTNEVLHSVDAVNILKHTLPAEDWYLTIYNPREGT